MAYEKQTWNNLPNKTTPLSAARLNHLETQYDEAVAYVDSEMARTGAYHVKDFGAVGDGVTDDAPALRRALTAAQGGVLEFSRGLSYRVGQPLNLYSGTDVDLNGATLVRGFDAHASGRGLLFAIGQTNILVRGGTLDGNGGQFPSDPPGFNIFSGWDLDGLTIRDCTLRDVVAFHAIDIYNVSRVLIEDNRFEGFKHPPSGREFSEAIQLDPGGLNKGIVVRGNSFTSSDTPGFGPWPCGVGNHATDEGTPSTSSQVVIEGNTFEGCSFSGVHALYWSDVIISGNFFSQCAEAVRVSRGSFPGQLTRGVSISNNSVTQPPGGVAFNLRMAVGVSLSENLVTGGGSGCRVEYVTGCSISGNHFQDMTQNAVYVAEAAYPSANGTGLTRRVSISGNQGHNIGFRGIHVNCVGRDVSITGNVFQGVSNSDTPRAGIQVDAGWRGGLIGDNTVSDDTSLPNKPNYGVYLLASSHDITVGTNRLFGTLAPIRNDSSPG